MRLASQIPASRDTRLACQEKGFSAACQGCKEPIEASFPAPWLTHPPLPTKMFLGIRFHLLLTHLPHGGEKGSTGIVKLEWHAEVPACS